jgi:ribosome-binding factor A
MKKTSQRARRVGDEIQRDLAELLRSEVKDPRVGPVTITAVDVSTDLSHAKVFVTHMAGREHADEAVKALQRTAGFLRSALAHRLSLYSVPQLHFAYDDFDRDGHEAVAVDRRCRGGGSQASALMSTTRVEAGRLPPAG